MKVLLRIMIVEIMIFTITNTVMIVNIYDSILIPKHGFLSSIMNYHSCKLYFILFQEIFANKTCM